MKKLFLVILVGLFLVGCSPELNPTMQSGKKLDSGFIIGTPQILNPDYVIEVEGCEYFAVYAYGGYSFVHKGNCKNKIHPENR